RIQRQLRKEWSGRSGARTHKALAGSAVFETAAVVRHSACPSKGIANPRELMADGERIERPHGSSPWPLLSKQAPYLSDSHPGILSAFRAGPGKRSGERTTRKPCLATRIREQRSPARLSGSLSST